jgi:DNA-directed RNA polymerase subunit RPC12/RpoP
MNDVNDAISRQQAIETFKDCAVNGVGIDGIVDALNQLPPAEPKRGKWNRLDMDTFNCNQCGTTFVLNQGSEKMHFCPNCGAKMEVTE